MELEGLRLNKMNTAPSSALSIPYDIPGPAGRWWVAVLAGAVVAAPIGWLLSYAASLPFFLGLFFFMLLGLMIGAVVFRVAAPKRPYAKWPILIGTTLLVALTWGLSLVKEAVDFPADVARRTTERTKDLGGLTPKAFRDAVAVEVRAFLAERYGPGPYWGYVRWVLTSGQIKKGELTSVPRELKLPAAHMKGWWALRVVLSIALLSYGISSQTLPLRSVRQPTSKEP